MKRNIKNSESQDLQKIVNLILDPELNYDERLIKENNWLSYPIFQYLLPDQAEWLASAAILCNDKEILAFDIEYGKEFTYKRFLPSRDSIINFLFASNGAVVITNDSIDFVYFKDQLNRFSVMSGSYEFIKNSYPCSFDTIRIMFEYFALDIYQNQEDIAYYKRIQKSYFHLSEMNL